MRTTAARWASFISAGLGLGFMSMAAEEQTPSGFGIAPEPEWVEPKEWAPLERAPEAGTPATILLSDSQDRIFPKQSEYYYHLVIQLHNNEGVRANAEVTATFDPDDEAVYWNILRIRRGDDTINLLPQVKFKQLQRESGLEAKVFNEEVTVVAVLEDVRVGDILEFAYTRRNVDHLMQGRVSARHYHGAQYPIEKQSVLVRIAPGLPPTRCYLWAPADTQGLPDELFRSSFLARALKQETTDAGSIYHWEAEHLPAIVFDDHISPHSAPYYPLMRVSSFLAWGEVADWAEPLFAIKEAPTALKDLAAGWRSRWPNDMGRQLQAAVDWTQREIRYFAMAIGNHNLKPRPLAEICETRFGDCKDKSVTLVALLRELGLQAWPALVHSYSQAELPVRGPDQYAFNHAIVAYEYEGRVHWVDPTLQQPGGKPGTWALPSYRYALILRRSSYALDSIPPDPMTMPDSETRDRIRVSDDGTARMEVEVTLRRLQADYYRQSLDSVSARERSQSWFNFLTRFYPRLEETESPKVTDNIESNEITLRATYRLPGFLQKEQGQEFFVVHAYGLRTVLNPLESRRRHWPLALPNNRRIRHSIEVEGPGKLAPLSNPLAVRIMGMDYQSEKGALGQRYLATHDLRVGDDHAMPDKMEAFSDSLQEILLDLSAPVFLGKQTTVKGQPETEPKPAAGSN